MLYVYKVYFKQGKEEVTKRIITDSVGDALVLAGGYNAEECSVTIEEQSPLISISAFEQEAKNLNGAKGEK